MLLSAVRHLQQLVKFMIFKVVLLFSVIYILPLLVQLWSSTCFTWYISLCSATSRFVYFPFSTLQIQNVEVEKLHNAPTWEETLVIINQKRNSFSQLSAWVLKIMLNEYTTQFTSDCWTQKRAMMIVFFIFSLFTPRQFGL